MKLFISTIILCSSFSVTLAQNTRTDYITISNAEEWYLYTPDKLNLYMYEFGKGDTVVVLHGGFGAEHSYLLDVLRPLADKFHFVCFDQRGSLRSPATDSLLTLPKMLDDIEQIRKELKQDRIKILAHSIGTLVAMSYANKYPAHVQSLTLVGAFAPKADSLFSTDRMLYRDGQAIQYLGSRAEVVEMRKKENVYNRNSKEMTARENTKSWRIGFAAVNMFNIKNYKLIKGGVAFYNQKTGDALFNSGTVPVNWDFVGLFNQYHILVTVVNGDYDYVDFTALSDEGLLKQNEAYLKEQKMDIRLLKKSYNWKDFTKIIPTLQLHIVKKAGHNGWRDAPEEYKKYLTKGLSR